MNDDLTSKSIMNRNKEVENTISKIKMQKNDALKHQIDEAKNSMRPTKVENYGSNTSSDVGVYNKINKQFVQALKSKYKEEQNNLKHEEFVEQSGESKSDSSDKEEFKGPDVGIVDCVID